MSKKAYLILLPALLLSLMLSLVPGCAKTPPPAEEEAAVVKAAPLVTITPNVAKLDSKLQMVIMGSGFEPGQAFHLFVIGPGQPANDIRDACTPPIGPGKDENVGEYQWIAERALKADETGAWITVWTLKDYIKMLAAVAANKGEGLHTIEVRDVDANLLASTLFALADTTKPKEQQPAWAQVLLK